MAKTKICPICGKEYLDGFFKNDESGVLYLSEGSFKEDSYAIHCCKACHERYKEAAEINGQRFAAKITNMKKARRCRLSDAQIAKLFVSYIEEAQNYTPYEGDDALPFTFCFTTPDGRFCVREAVRGMTYLTGKQYVKALDKLLTFNKNFVFSKEDVSMLEYRVQEEVNSTLFSTVMSFEIRLNDDKNMTFKPCVTRFYVAGKGLFPKRAAKREMRRLMEVFKEKVGVDAPITFVKKFK